MSIDTCSIIVFSCRLQEQAHYSIRAPAGAIRRTRHTSLHGQAASRRSPMVASEVLLTVESLCVEHRAVEAGEDVVERALAADAEAALHITLHAQLRRNISLTADAMQRDEQTFGAAGVDGWGAG